ncbi:BppU family phage baseplate upper protein [Bacillus altitudinis]|uniref:BppU family phage baseplate upper protein n=1 Tax=Bacillus altitudinis TaxID=293387 RepID=UPI003CF7CF0E
MLAKNGALAFDVNSQTKRPINAAIQFSTQDINTARLSFKLTKDGAPLPLSAVVGKLVLAMADGSRFVRSVALVNKPEGLAEYLLTADEIRHYGAVKAELLLYYTNGQALSIHKFGFNIERSLIDQNIVPVAEYYIDDFESLREQINDLYDDVVATVAEIEAKFEDLDNLETKIGAQAKVDAHAGNKDVHVTAQKKAEWDAKETTAGAQSKVTAHANDVVKHVTNEERSAWNSKETTTGAQLKVDTHEAKSELHVTEASKLKWDGAQLHKITTDGGFLKQLTATDLNTVTATGVYYNSLASTDLNAPVNNNGYLTVLNHGDYPYQEYVPYVGSSSGVPSIRRKFFRNKISGSSNWSAWAEDVVLKDTIWQTPSLSNGWKQYVSPDGFSHTLRYTKDAMGVVEIIGSIAGGALGANVTAFTLLPDYFPNQSMHFIGVASSVGTTNVPQYHRTYIGTDGKVCIQSCSNSANPNEFITFGFRFRAAKV